MITIEEMETVRQLLRGEASDSSTAYGVYFFSFPCGDRIDQLMMEPNGSFCYINGGVDLIVGFFANELLIRDGSTVDSFMFCFNDRCQEGVSPRLLITRFDGLCAVRIVARRPQTSFEFPLQV
jgi:hypothetical protein